MSDLPQISLQQAIDGFAGGTPQEQPETEAAHEEDQTTQEAADLSESEDDPEEQLADGEEAEQDSEDDEAGETDEDEEAEEEDAEEPVFTVTVDGKKEQVTQSELIQGYQRLSDYTRKTQAVTEQRKHLEAQAEQVREREITLLEGVTTQLLGTPPAKPDINLMRTDPATYEEQKYAYEQWYALKAGFDDWRGKVVQERDKEAQNKRAEAAKAEGQRFLKAFEAEVKDEASFSAKIGEIQAVLVSAYGYAPEELAGMIDHRAYLVAEDARKYRMLMADKKPKAEMKAKKAKLKPVTSGSAQRKPKRSSERDQARNRFIESTSRPAHTISRNEQINAAAEAYLAGRSAKD